MPRLRAALATLPRAVITALALHGAGSPACMEVGRALVQDLFHGRERPCMMAYEGMAMGLCPPLATLLGWQLNFEFMAALAVLGLGLRWRARLA